MRSRLRRSKRPAAPATARFPLPIRLPALPAALRDSARRRGVGLVAALVLETLLILLMLSLGMSNDPPEFAGEKLTSFDVTEDVEQPQPPQPSPEPPSAPAAAAQVAQSQPQPQPANPVPALPQPAQQPPAIAIPVKPVSPAPAAPAAPQVRAVIRGQNYGPSDTGRQGIPDSQRVGTAPNGKPLYAADWYRKPYDDETRGYLSLARGPGWGLIACRTAPDWRVEDCVELGESPQGSGIAHAVASAAWQFKVRPPRVGGDYKIGEWVRIRIDYQTRVGPDTPAGPR